MEQLILLGTIGAGVGAALFASKMGLQFIVDQIPVKAPNGTAAK